MYYLIRHNCEIINIVVVSVIKCNEIVHWLIEGYRFSSEYIRVIHSVSVAYVYVDM